MPDGANVYTEAVVNVNVANIRLEPSIHSPVITQMERGARLPVTGSSGQWIRVLLYNSRLGWISRDIVSVVPNARNRPVQEILVYYTEQEGPELPSSYQSFVANVAEISDVGLFHFRIDRQNPTQVAKLYEFDSSYMRRLVEFGHRHNVKMLPVVSNLLYERGKQGVNKDVIRGMLSTSDNRSTFIANLLMLIQEYGFDGIHIDFEDVYFEDRFLLATFYQELGDALRKRGYHYVVSTPARTSDHPTNPFSASFDYGLIGSAVNEFVAMLYNEHGWPGSGPGPVVSIGWMEKVIRYAMTKMPAGKITAAVSVFGFDFNLTTGKIQYATYAMAMSLASRYGQSIIFDQKSQTPMFRYTDQAGNRHEVWFENAESIRAKLNLAHRLGIRGLALWRLGMEDPNLWNMLKKEFVIKKGEL
ncbi:glycosyl hydrolase family 18 protein [Fodinisporobacter ferrooxydans]|uniref:Glycosyl hydrolase family 18 protein n=1 Tax=Fodinisporobacter ferrooxydans TaxID=2901836 RepID=A0ABY4CIA3_9BACL|nr:glycosyl hydrolase family 18 protein [Alicyclobacillaceae bacterium MYW30-H2]